MSPWLKAAYVHFLFRCASNPDFDGVLHPVHPRDDLPEAEAKPFCYMARFAQVMRDFPEVEIIISSTWRLHRSLEQLREYFPADLRSRVVGVTPELVADERFGGRQLEGIAWLKEHCPGAAWIALDDLTTAWAPESLVLCADGFRQTEELRLRTLLGACRRK
jgi:hypothetical protein